MFIFALDKCSNQYPLVGGMRQRRFDGTRLKPRKLLENAQTPTSRVLACKRDPQGLRSGTFLDMLPFVQGTGTRIRERCVEVQPISV
jgi:hypothetical protein